MRKSKFAEEQIATMRYRSQRKIAPELVADLRQVAMESTAASVIAGCT